MTATLLQLPDSRPADGGLPARRAVVQWAWRLFWREWRQQVLILALIIVAVAATIIGAAVATNSPQPANFGFGTAQDLATYQGNDTHLASQIASLEHRFGTVEVIENESERIPGSVNTYQVRAESADGTYSGPMLSLVSGHYPINGGEVALTSGLAHSFGVGIGGRFDGGGVSRRVVGIVENPQSLLDEFALVEPGQVTAPSQVLALFDAPGIVPRAIGPNVSTPQSAAPSTNFINPETITIAALTVGMLLIALMAIGGFTVLAQRRLRSLGMLASLGATDRHVSLVVRANGLVVGLVGAVAGTVVGFVGWLAYRPTLEQTSHHLIGVFSLPWLVVALAMVLAVVATYFAASRPAHAITKTPIISALSGRPAPPRQIHRSAIPGILLLVIAFLLFGVAGSNSHGGGMPEVALGFLTLIPGVILLSPFFISLVPQFVRRAPIATRLALRDLARYRARSGSALSAISVGVLIAVIIVLVAAERYGNQLDYAGPNLASNQAVVEFNPPPPAGTIITTPTGSYTESAAQAAHAPSSGSQEKTVKAIAAALGTSQVVELDSPDANLNHAASGRNWNGQIYVATPQLLKLFGITASQIDPNADVLTMRSTIPGLSLMQLQYGTGGGSFGGNFNGPGNVNQFPCPKGSCIANPPIQLVSALPSGTQAPNTVITEHAMRTLHLQSSPQGWLIQTTQPITSVQLNDAELIASSSPVLAVDSKNDEPTSSSIIDWATIFGIALALGILGMSVGLIRSETAGDLRTLTATGASSTTRRTLTAATAGALGFLGAVLGTIGGYVGVIGFSSSNSLDGLSGLLNIPLRNLLLIVVAMPIVAAVAGWLLAGRQPPAIAHRPIE